MTTAQKNDEVEIFAGVEQESQDGPAVYSVKIRHVATGRTKDFRLQEGRSTPNETAIKAAILGLSKLKRECRVRLYSDSEYLINGVSGAWTINSHPELWERLRRLTQSHQVELCRTDDIMLPPEQDS